MASWEQYLLNELPRYTAHPGLEALLVFASIPSDPIAITTTTTTTSKSAATAASATSPTSPLETSPITATSPTAAITSPTSTTATSSSTNAWAWDWLHVWPLLGIAPAEAATLEDEDRSLLHFTGLRPAPGGGAEGQFDAYRGMLREFLSDKDRAGRFAVVGGGVGAEKANDEQKVTEKEEEDEDNEMDGDNDEPEEKGHGAETVAQVAESVCRYLMEPKKA